MRSAEEKAAGIRADAEREAELIIKEAAARGEKEARMRAKLILTAAETETKKALLSMKRELISRAFDLAIDKLLKLDKAAYVALLAGLAARASETGDEEMILNERDAENCGTELVAAANRLVNGRMTLSDRRRNIKGGFILSRGRVEINCALETLAALRKNELSPKVAELLFSEGCR